MQYFGTGQHPDSGDPVLLVAAMNKQSRGVDNAIFHDRFASHGQPLLRIISSP